MKKILLAVDESVHSKRAAEYTAKVVSGNNDIACTLFTLQPCVPDLLLQGADTESQTKPQIEGLVRKNRQESEHVVQKLKTLMVREGVPENRIETATQSIQQGIAKDILMRAQQGQYDAIVIARRGLTPSRDFYFGSVAAKVVEHAMAVPVWIVDEEPVPSNILLALDGSENSPRIVKYVTDFVGPNQDITLTFFHVLPHLRHYFSIDFEKEHLDLQQVLHRQDKRRMDTLYEEIHQVLEERGLRESQIGIKTNTKSYDIPTAVLGEARTGQYGTIVVSRRGERGAFFIGRTAMRLIQKMSDQTLWVIP